MLPLECSRVQWAHAKWRSHRKSSHAHSSNSKYLNRNVRAEVKSNPRIPSTGLFKLVQVLKHTPNKLAEGPWRPQAVYNQWRNELEGNHSSLLKLDLIIDVQQRVLLNHALQQDDLMFFLVCLLNLHLFDNSHDLLHSQLYSEQLLLPLEPILHIISFSLCIL